MATPLSDHAADLLDDGSWVLEQSIRVRHDAHTLADETREFALTYEWFRPITGGSGDAAVITTLHEFLDSAPGDALCDICLAFACAVSVTEIRELTESFLRLEPEHFQRAAMCSGCRRTAPSIVYT